jgi:hypothetical protein
MPSKLLLRLLLLLIIEVLTIVLVFALFDFFILPTGESIRVYDWFLFEGLFCIILSVLLALGRGGIDAYTLRSAATAAAADAIYGSEYQVSEVFRKDKWKPEGFPKAALVLLIAGIVMLVIYFLTL